MAGRTPVVRPGRGHHFAAPLVLNDLDVFERPGRPVDDAALATRDRQGSTPSARRARSREDLPGVWRGAHLPALDGLRGLAVVGVLAFHDRRLTGGWLGVDLFFTLSGFLITSLLVAEVHRRGAVGLRHFWARRAKRLLPAFVFLIGGLAVWGHLSDHTPWVTTDLRGASLASLGYGANWYQLFAGGGYWSRFGAPSPLQHAWSLAIEEQFYVVFPLVAWAVARRAARPARALLAICVAGWAASFTATLVLGRGDDVNRVYLGTDTRIGSILVGAALACVLALARPADEGEAGSRWRRTLPFDAAGVLVVLVLARMWMRTNGAGTFGPRGGLTLHAVLVAALITVVVRRPTSLVAWLLARRPLVWLGTISYGLYLWHWPVFVYVDQRVDASPLAATIIKVSASLALATASLFVVERPIRRKGTAVLGGWMPTVAVAVLVVVTVALLPAAQVGGTTGDLLADAPRSAADLRNRPVPKAGGPVSTLAPGATTTSRPASSSADLPRFDPDRGGRPLTDVLARPGRIAGPPRILTIGDSIPLLLGAQLETDQASLGIQVANRALPGCSMAKPEAERVDTERLEPPPDCSPLWIDDVVAFDPDVIVLSLNGDLGQEHEYDGRWGSTCSAAYAKHFTANTETKLRLLAGHGSAVYILTPLLLERAVFRRPWSGSARDCLSRIERRVADRIGGVRVIRFGEWVCPDIDRTCRTSLAGRPIERPDGLHFAGPEAAYVWSLILPTMLRDAGIR